MKKRQYFPVFYPEEFVTPAGTGMNFSYVYNYGQWDDCSCVGCTFNSAD